MDGNACSWCGTEIADGVETCTSCGARVAPPRAETGSVDGGTPNGGPVRVTAAPAGSTPAWASPAAVGQAPVETAQTWAPPVVAAQTWAPPVPQPPPGAAVVPATWTPPATAERTGTRPLVWVVVASFAAVVVFAVARMMGGDLVTFPDTVLSQPKMTGPQIDAIVDGLEDTRIAGGSFRAAFYGSATPTLMIIVADASSLANPEESWQGFGGGFASTSGTSIDQRAKRSAVIDGVNYICSPVAGMASTVCQWTDDRTTGYVFDYTVGDANASITRTQEVYEVVVVG